MKTYYYALTIGGLEYFQWNGLCSCYFLSFQFNDFLRNQVSVSSFEYAQILQRSSIFHVKYIFLRVQ